MSFNRISIKDVKDLLLKDDLILIDIRDYNSFKNGHIDNAIHVEDLNIQNFLKEKDKNDTICLLYTSPSPRDRTTSRMPSSA